MPYVVVLRVLQDISNKWEGNQDMTIAERDAQAQARETLVDEAEILKNVLGERRGHTKGVGRKLKAVSRYQISSNNNRPNEMKLINIFWKCKNNSWKCNNTC
ncbi:hypothetical protein LXL04_023040 [Taraxacum kok-saghyz]